LIFRGERTNGSDRFTKDPVLQALSSGCEVVGCSVEEHVMVSTAVRWKDGQKIWQVIHDAQKDIEHLDVKGEPPLEFSAIRDRLKSQQQAAGGKKSDTDYIFDIPVDLAEVIIGYRYDKDLPGPGKEQFEVLIDKAASGEKKSWLKELFGR
jgi:hypothetical protein